MQASGSASPAPQCTTTLHTGPEASSSPQSPPSNIPITNASSTSPRPSSPPMQTPPGVLQGKEDMYSGVIVHAEQLEGCDPDGFACTLDTSLEYWRSISKRGIWLKVPLASAALVPVAANKGFVFHHAEPVSLVTHGPGRTTEVCPYSSFQLHGFQA